MISPRFSVIIPAYNREHLIGAAINSVLAQTFADFELLVVDDASTDGTAAAVRAIFDPRVKIIALTINGGSNAARNAGIAVAKGEILAFLDSDDVYLPDKLANAAEFFEAHPAIDVFVDSFLRLTSPKAKRKVMEIRNPDTRSTAEFALALFRRDLWKATSSIAVRRQAALRAGCFAEDIKQRQDFDFLIRLTEGANCASSSEIGWIKGWTDDRITSRERFVAATVALVRRHPQYLSNRAYRGGLARDLARNGYLLIREGQWRSAVSDLGLASREFGVVTTVGLVARGIGQALSRMLRQRRKASSRTSSEALQLSLSPAVESALEAVRNRGSRRISTRQPGQSRKTPA